MNEQTVNQPTITEPARDKIQPLIADYLQKGSELLAITFKLGECLNLLESSMGRDEFAKWIVNILPLPKARYIIDTYTELMGWGNWEVSWRLTKSKTGGDLTFVTKKLRRSDDIPDADSI